MQLYIYMYIYMYHEQKVLRRVNSWKNYRSIISTERIVCN